jgi:hypothetical protein
MAEGMGVSTMKTGALSIAVAAEANLMTRRGAECAAATGKYDRDLGKRFLGVSVGSEFRVPSSED